MEGDTNYLDLIDKYKMFLESEKRRLTPANINLTKIDSESLTQTIETDVSQKEQQEIVKNIESAEESKIVGNSPEDAVQGVVKKNLINQKQAKTMEQWVTDSFYTSFPSFRKQDFNKKALADDRREDYKKYLAEVANRKNIAKPTPNTEFSARDRLLSDLKHSDAAYNFHNPDAIEERNQTAAVERARRKTELQQELLRQIEDKKLEIQKIRAKEKEEDELLQRRLESQIKALQVTEELTKKSSERALISNPVNQTSRSRGPIPRRDLEKTIQTSKSEDGYPEDRMKRDANNDRQIYKFFSNSAPQNEYYNHPVGYYNLPFVEPQFHHISTDIHNPNQNCNRCRRTVPMLCNSCCRNQVNTWHYSCYRCNLLQNMDNCNNCVVNQYGLNMYQRDNRPQILEIMYHDNNAETHQSSSQDKRNKIEVIHSKSPDTNGNSLDNKALSDNHSSLRHNDKVPENVSLSKEQEMLELKRKNDILIAKYARNYGSLRKRKTVGKGTDSEFVNDSFPLPLMREHLAKTSSTEVNVEPIQRSSRAVRNLEYKWEIPVVQKQVMARKPGQDAQVLTQVGAIAKQLQLEKLNFGDA